MAASTVTELTSLTTAQQDTLRDAAIVAVEDFTGQPFTSVTETRRIDGPGGRVLQLPWRLSSYTALRIHGETLPLGDLQLNREKNRVTLKSEASGNYYERTLRAEFGEPSIFDSGYENVEIDGLWGWADGEFPAAVAVALRYDMEDQARTDQNQLTTDATAYRRLGVRSIRQGRVAVEFEAPAAVTVSDRVARALRGYVWPGVGALA